VNIFLYFSNKPNLVPVLTVLGGLNYICIGSSNNIQKEMCENVGNMCHVWVFICYRGSSMWSSHCEVVSRLLKKCVTWPEANKSRRVLYR